MPTAKNSLCLLALTLACSASAKIDYAVLRRKGVQFDINGIELQKAKGLNVAIPEAPVMGHGLLDEEEEYGDYEEEDYATATYDPSGSADPSGSIAPTPCPLQCVIGCSEDWESKEEIYWCDVDSDGDGVGDYREHRDGTDPAKFCSFKSEHVNTDVASDEFLLGDCDNDCVINLQELIDHTNPHDKCSNHVLEMARKDSAFFYNPSIHGYELADEFIGFSGKFVIALGMNAPSKLYEHDFSTHNEISICGMTKHTCDEIPFEKSGFTQEATDDTTAYLQPGDRSTLAFPGEPEYRPQVHIDLKNLHFYSRQFGLNENEEAPRFIMQDASLVSDDTASVDIFMNNIKVDGWGTNTAGDAMIHTEISTIMMYNSVIEHVRAFFCTVNSGTYQLPLANLYRPLNVMKHNVFKHIGNGNEGSAVGFNYGYTEHTEIFFDNCTFRDIVAGDGIINFGLAGEHVTTAIVNSQFHTIVGDSSLLIYETGSAFDIIQKSTFQNIELNINSAAVVHVTVVERVSNSVQILDSQFEDIVAYDIVYVHDISTKPDQVIEVIFDSATRFYNNTVGFAVARVWGEHSTNKIVLEVNSGFRMNKATYVLNVDGVKQANIPNHFTMQENNVCISAMFVDALNTTIAGGELTFNNLMDKDGEFCGDKRGNMFEVGSGVELSRALITLTYRSVTVYDFNIENNVMGTPQEYTNTSSAVLMLDNFAVVLVPRANNFTEASVLETSLNFHESVVIKSNVVQGVFGFVIPVFGVNVTETGYWDSLYTVQRDANPTAVTDTLDFCVWKYLSFDLNGNANNFETMNEFCYT